MGAAISVDLRVEEGWFPKGPVLGGAKSQLRKSPPKPNEPLHLRGSLRCLSLGTSRKSGLGNYIMIITSFLPLSLSSVFLPSLPSFLEQLLSIEQSEVIEEEVLAEEEVVPFMQKELPEQKLPELENGTKLEEPAGQKETAQKEEKVAKPKGPPRQEKKPRVKEEL